MSTENVRKNSESDIDGDATDHDPHYEPIVSLPLVDLCTNEEHEEELCKIRARLYRYNAVDHEWKERGTGDIKLLRHKDNHSVRVVMRRDKTLKICANHFVTPDIEMKVHCGSDKAFFWSVYADFADETPKQELLAIKFGNVANANIWKNKFAEAQMIVKTQCKLYNGECSLSDEDEEETDSDASQGDVEDNKKSESDTDRAKSKTSKNEEAGVTLKLSQLKVESK